MAKLQQVFIGCPFAKEVRKPFDRLKREIEAETPLAIVLADTVGVTSSDYLLEHITELIRDSAGCVFDATGTNPNVSLEVGIAHTIPVDFMLTFKTRKRRTGGASGSGAKDAEVRSIISDLQGKNRIEYKTFESLKQQLKALVHASLHEAMAAVHTGQQGHGASRTEVVRRPALQRPDYTSSPGSRS